MLLKSLISLALAGTSFAQTPAGFTPSVNDTLTVKFGSKNITPGAALGKADTGKAPTIGTADAALVGNYIFIVLDIDIPGQYAGGPAGSRANNLHALITGYKSATTQTSGVYVLSTTATGPAAYQAPGPPAETPPYPHKYIELLYTQPSDFKISTTQSSAISKRVGFNVTAFATDSKLGLPVRANYFTQVAGA